MSELFNQIEAVLSSEAGVSDAASDATASVTSDNSAGVSVTSPRSAEASAETDNEVDFFAGYGDEKPVETEKAEESPTTEDEEGDNPFETAPANIKETEDFQKLLTKNQSLIGEKQKWRDKARAYEAATGVNDPAQLQNGKLYANQIFQEVQDAEGRPALSAQKFIDTYLASDSNALRTFANELLALDVQGKPVFDRVLEHQGKVAISADEYQKLVQQAHRNSEVESDPLYSEVPADHQRAYAEMTVKERTDYWEAEYNPADQAKLVERAERQLAQKAENSTKEARAAQKEAQTRAEALETLQTAQSSAIMGRTAKLYNTFVNNFAAHVQLHPDPALNKVLAEGIANQFISLTEESYHPLVQNTIQTLGLAPADLSGIVADARAMRDCIAQAEVFKLDKSPVMAARYEREAAILEQKLMGRLSGAGRKLAALHGNGLRGKAKATNDALTAARTRPDFLTNGSSGNGNASPGGALERLYAQVKQMGG